MEKENSHHKTMLEIAKHAIEARARLDGYAEDEYDASDDPDGYVVSILNALHQHCLVNGVDWHDELFRAQRFFEQDMAEADPAPGESRRQHEKGKQYGQLRTP